MYLYPCLHFTFTLPPLNLTLSLSFSLSSPSQQLSRTFSSTIYRPISLSGNVILGSPASFDQAAQLVTTAIPNPHPYSHHPATGNLLTPEDKKPSKPPLTVLSQNDIAEKLFGKIIKEVLVQPEAAATTIIETDNTRQKATISDMGARVTNSEGKGRSWVLSHGYFVDPGRFYAALSRPTPYLPPGSLPSSWTTTTTTSGTGLGLGGIFVQVMPYCYQAPSPRPGPPSPSLRDPARSCRLLTSAEVNRLVRINPHQCHEVGNLWICMMNHILIEFGISVLNVTSHTIRRHFYSYCYC